MNTKEEYKLSNLTECDIQWPPKTHKRTKEFPFCPETKNKKGK